MTGDRSPADRIIDRAVAAAMTGKAPTDADRAAAREACRALTIPPREG